MSNEESVSEGDDSDFDEETELKKTNKGKGGGKSAVSSPAKPSIKPRTSVTGWWNDNNFNLTIWVFIVSTGYLECVNPQILTVLQGKVCCFGWLVLHVVTGSMATRMLVWGNLTEDC